ncbi:uncharacterized protein LOC112213907 [Bombus impatiens]|uniref:Uncharacterized protein LOC112213907 n=1 Tax=Bombus impatiens TaxID=132113 RepID=A0A6P8LLW7_BOMIM|nr:uncharacterized protein LOC112213907 [Bombus impatiens]
MGSIDIIDTLFTTKTNITAEEERRDGSYEEVTSDDVCITVQMEELANAIGRLNFKRAAGVGGVSGTIFKLLFKHKAHNILSMINTIYKINKILKKWKNARVILQNQEIIPSFLLPIGS